MTKRHQRYLATLIKRRDTLNARIIATNDNAAFLSELVHECHAMEWAIAVIIAADEFSEAKNK